jgi:hypothetical protein
MLLYLILDTFHLNEIRGFFGYSRRLDFGEFVVKYPSFSCVNRRHPSSYHQEQQQEFQNL